LTAKLADSRTHDSTCQRCSRRCGSTLKHAQLRPTFFAPLFVLVAAILLLAALLVIYGAASHPWGGLRTQATVCSPSCTHQPHHRPDRVTLAAASCPSNVASILSQSSGKRYSRSLSAAQLSC
jgi:predicted nucleic acid-binding Zn ribbon protein